MLEITELLKAWNEGDTQALDRLMTLVDPDLKKIAHNYLRHEKPGHILQTTALVNEALIKLIRENITWENRKHFYALVAKRMRQVLIDDAKNRSAEKRSKWGEQVEVAALENVSSTKSKELLRLEEALTDLAQIDERKVTIIECRFFIGLNLDEIAEMLDISATTVERDWLFARSWLKRYLSPSSIHSPSE